ncbi:MAG TPA: host attachment protein [Acidiferrobacter sp.]|nr:host attachment protein [Acidiferrobacter sp.]
MNHIWVLVAHRGGARIFESAGRKQDLKLRQDIPHSQGKLKNRDIGSDRPGRGVNSQGSRTSLQQAQEPTAHIAEQFAKQLAELLNAGRVKRLYEKLVLIAEPHFLGLLHAALSSESTALVIASVPKDLAHTEIQGVRDHLEGIIRV